ncbi:MAG: PD-(D/E)XK nuclease family protein, partial [Actinobacteria bacterium]|nr:PD-(D/E)XK nuclease family protein [Actinomycetota bacterium]
ALRKLLVELEGWRSLGGEVAHDELVRASDRAHGGRATRREPGRVAVLDLARARTRRFAVVFVLGLEEGVLPRRGSESPFLPDAERRELEEERRARRLARPDSVSRDRYLFYTACTRAWARLTLVREAATDDGRPREPSPFTEEVRSRFAPDDVARWTRRRALSELTWGVDRAPTERERLRAAAGVAAAGEEAEARALARANGWERRMERALGAFTRHTRLTHPEVLRELAETTRFSVTELETFGNCSSMWLFDRVVDPKAIDGELDVRLRGGVAHQALYRFYTGLPKRLGTDRVEPERLDDALAFLGECIREAIAGQVRIDLSDVERLELEGTLARDLEHFVRQEVELGFPLVPRRFEVLFGTPGAPVELQRGLDLGGFTVSGKIDRIDVDPMSARGIVQDYKSGSTAHSAAQIEAAGLLQIPLYVLALRDLVGIEPLGGLYRALAGPREARGLVLASAVAEVPHLKRGDYVDDEEFWAQVEAAKGRARTAVRRIRDGDVRHDPRGGRCPSWCERWTMCRIARA